MNLKNPNPAADGIYAPMVGDIVAVVIAATSANLRPYRSERYPNIKEPQKIPINMIAA